MNQWTHPKLLQKQVIFKYRDSDDCKLKVMSLDALGTLVLIFQIKPTTRLEQAGYRLKSNIMLILKAIQFSKNIKIKELIWKMMGLNPHSGGRIGSVQHDCIWNSATQNSRHNL